MPSRRNTPLQQTEKYLASGLPWLRQSAILPAWFTVTDWPAYFVDSNRKLRLAWQRSFISQYAPALFYRGLVRLSRHSLARSLSRSLTANLVRSLVRSLATSLATRLSARLAASLATSLVRTLARRIVTSLATSLSRVS